MSPGLVHARTIAVFIMSVQYLAEILLSNIRRPVTKGGADPLENFSPTPGKMCWT